MKRFEAHFCGNKYEADLILTFEGSYNHVCSFAEEIAKQLGLTFTHAEEVSQ